MGCGQQSLLGFNPAANSAPPTFVAAGVMTADVTAFALPLPAGIQADDILVAFINTDNAAVTVSGFTAAGNSPVTSTAYGERFQIFWKRAGSSESAPTVSDSGLGQVGVMLAFRGCISTGNPFDVTGSNYDTSTNSTITVPGVTTTVANTLIIAANSSYYSANATSLYSGWTNGNLSNVTERVDQSKSASLLGGSIGIATGEKVAAGATGNTTATRGGGHTASDKMCWVGALKGP